jgi:hypothetical protein
MGMAWGLFFALCSVVCIFAQGISQFSWHWYTYLWSSSNEVIIG